MRGKTLAGLFTLLLLFLYFTIILPDRFVYRQQQTDAEQLERLIAKTYQYFGDLASRSDLKEWSNLTEPASANLLHYRSDSLIQWLNNLVLPPKSVRTVLKGRPEAFIPFETPSGVYVCWSIDSAGATRADQWLGIQQLLATTTDKSGQVQRSLPPELGRMPDRYYQEDDSGIPVFTPGDEELIRLHLSSPPDLGRWWYPWFFLSIVLVALFTRLILGIKIPSLQPKSGKWRAVIMLMLAGIELLFVTLVSQSHFYELLSSAPFHPSEETTRFLSFLIPSAIAILLFSLYRLSGTDRLHLEFAANVRAILTYLGMIGGMFLILKLAEFAVFQSGIDFFYTDIFQIEPAAWIFIGSLIVLIFSLFIWSIHWVRNIQESGMKFRQRILLFGLAFAIMLIPYFLIGSESLVLAFLLSSLALASLVDWFVESRQRDFTWLIVWLMVFAGYTSNLLFALQNKRPTQIQVETARLLAEQVDPVLARFLEDFPKDRPGDRPGTSPNEQQAGNWDIHWNKNPYLPAWYDYTISTSGDTGLIHNLIVNDWGAYRYCLSDSLEVQIRTHNRPVGAWRFEPFSPPPFRGLAALSRYHYAVYGSSGQVISSDKESPFPNNISPQQQAGAELRHQRVHSDSGAGTYEAFVFPNGQTVYLKFRDQRMIKPISLFSFLFMVLFLLTPIFTAIHRISPVLPGESQFNWAGNSSLGHRIQIYVLGLIVMTLLAIGIITVIYFQQTEQAQIMERNRERLDAARTELEELLGEMPVHNLPFNRVAASHLQSIRFFDLNGRLQEQSKGSILRLGLSPKQASPRAVREINGGRKDYLILTERIGARDYEVVYRAATDNSGQLHGIFGFPLPDSRQDIRSRVAGFFGMLLNVYAFLLLVAAAVAIGVAGTITQPLTRLRNSLTQVKLGRNEPIPYNSQDELGVLIREYNLMLEKLEESTRQLSRTERESAWREMAKRVAHEIKNPLTPMKLRLQHLRYVMNTDLEAARPLVESTTETLIEQIQALDEIASAFSSFAKMPEAEALELDLVELVRSTHQLFAGENEGVQLELEIPDHPLRVKADKNQMIRVFNNLYKNAQQAIPEDRAGLIRTSITTREGRVRVAICDNGSGIPEDAREKVFILEFTTKSFGSGLGLAMSKDIVTAFGGDIFFETKTGSGTCFFVELPLLPDSSETNS